MSIEIITTENDFLRIGIAPVLGGKIVSVYNKALQKEFLWHNAGLQLASYAPGTEYDPHFWGGIDELIPNDLVENIDGIDYPDHGELWTTPLDYEKEGDRIIVQGNLPLSGLYYKKTIYPEAGAAAFISEYVIRNESTATRHFLWKLHSALTIEAGDKLITGAQKAKVIDPAWSRFSDTNEFDWPQIENTDASIVPPKSNSVDFFYLYDQQDAFMKLQSGASVFAYHYDKKIFPCQWFFASYGGFLDHYTAILEPCTNMPMAVNDAMQSGYCAVLQPGEVLKTTVRIYAGKNDEA